MTRQIELFTPAIGYKQEALDAMQRFALGRAKAALEVAREIDPYLADTETLLQAVNFLLSLGLSASSKSAGLAKAWNLVRAARTTLAPVVYTRVESWLCERVLQCVPPETADFVDIKEQTLHVGYCHLMLGRYEEAHKTLLDYLTQQTHESHPALWGYFGDACYHLQRRDEANTGYLRALLMDPRAVDLRNLRHPDLRQIFEELQKRRPEETARAVLSIHGWLRGVLHIRPGSTWLSRMIDKQRFDHSSDLLLYPAQRYQQFALCLFIDQSGLHGDIDFDARTEMQRLDRKLFQRYLREVDRRNSERRRPLGKK